jgi:hypothetical protein
MKSLYSRLIIIVGALAVFPACVKKSVAPTVDSNILNYKIKEIPVTQDYTVGAFYAYYGNFNTLIKDTPVASRYNMPNGVVDPAVMMQHISQAGKGGIDYFVFSFRSANRDLNNYKIDSAVIKSFLDANDANMKFALAYNWSATSYTLTTTKPLEGDTVKLEQFFQDIQRVAPLLANSNYMKVNGKVLLYITNAQIIYSNNNSAIYTTLRSRLNALGFQLYIVGMQDRWSPPARYPFRFQNCVDAIYHQSYSSVLSDWDRFYLLPQMMDQNWKYSMQYWNDNKWGVDYIPCISPGYNQQILTPNSTNPVYGRTDNGVLYKQLCNVAKMNANRNTRLILIDSWNDWPVGTQLEAAKSYGDLYLNITKSEFKK